MTDIAHGPGTSALQARLGSSVFATVVELVPWRGSLDDDAGVRPRALAAALEGNPRIDAVSITDGAGGHAMMSPEVLANELVARGQDAIVHVACRDRNRNELLSLGWRLSGAGIRNVLVISGDYPVEGYLGVARPVFDLDSVALLSLYSEMNAGRVGFDVVGRPTVRDGAPSVPDLAPARNVGTPGRTRLFQGVAINPFKRVERDVIPQYLKLELKIRTGASFAITQVGYDARKLDELVRYMAVRDLRLPVLANVFILTRGSARVLHGGDVAGVVITDRLLAIAEKEAASPDKGRAFFLEMAARQVAIARGLGYAGAYLGGSSRAEDYERVLELADAFGPDDWKVLARDLRFAPTGTFYYFEDGLGDDLNGPAPRRLGRSPAGVREAASYRANRLVHDIAFAPGSRGFDVAGRVYGAIERVGLGHVAHIAEQAIKVPLFDCRDCGDCSLPEIAYLCPESQCAKNQRNGPCGGSHDGACEIPGKQCIWARAYVRLRPYGEERAVLERPPVVADNALRRTSAWANTFLGRDHTTRPRFTPQEEPRP